MVGNDIHPWELIGTRLFQRQPDGSKPFCLEVHYAGSYAHAVAEATKLQLLLNAQLRGAGLILTQRLEDEARYSAGHDDGYGHNQLIKAANAYLEVAEFQVFDEEHGPSDLDYDRTRAQGLRLWPWGPHEFTPGPDPVRVLAKAGAVIAAAIDRILRFRARKSSTTIPFTDGTLS